LYRNTGSKGDGAEEGACRSSWTRYDDAHGWHYHVTPGRFPYVLGGYWGETDARNFRKGKKY
jgi:hypothetical protein